MGTTYDKLEPGDRCIIEVDDVNRPTGLWWGLVDAVDQKDGYANVKAHITGPFQFTAQQFGSAPNYGSDNTQPSVNYSVYAATKTSIYLFQRLQTQASRHTAEVHNLRTRLSELRDVVKSMGVSRQMLSDVVHEAFGSKG